MYSNFVLPNWILPYVCWAQEMTCDGPFKRRSIVSTASLPKYVAFTLTRIKCPTLVTTSGYDLFTLRSPSNILGSSDGFTGSTAILITDCVLNLSGRNMCA